jgi:DNA-binding NarL/FixJ family response regulator
LSINFGGVNLDSVLIADSRRLVRAGLRAIFASFSIATHEVATLEELQKSMTNLAGKMIFIHQSFLQEIHLPRNAPYVVLTSEPNIHRLYQAFTQNARGYLSENAPAEIFHTALYLEKGDFLIDPKIIAWLLSVTSQQHIPPTIVEALTEREQEIFALMRAGLTNDEISRKLCVSLTTVKKHATNISRKLQLNRRSIRMLSLSHAEASAWE